MATSIRWKEAISSRNLTFGLVACSSMLWHCWRASSEPITYCQVRFTCWTARLISKPFDCLMHLFMFEIKFQNLEFRLCRAYYAHEGANSNGPAVEKRQLVVTVWRSIQPRTMIQALDRSITPPMQPKHRASLSGICFVGPLEAVQGCSNNRTTHFNLNEERNYKFFLNF